MAVTLLECYCVFLGLGALAINTKLFNPFFVLGCFLKISNLYKKRLAYRNHDRFDFSWAISLVKKQSLLRIFRFFKNGAPSGVGRPLATTLARERSSWISVVCPTSRMFMVCKRFVLPATQSNIMRPMCSPDSLDSWEKARTSRSVCWNASDE